MKYAGAILLILTFLLNGCFSGKEYPSGLLDSSGLKRSREEQRMMQLKQTREIRIGVSRTNQKKLEEFRKNLNENEWRFKVILCPENRLTGSLRTGALDLIYIPGATKENAETWNFIYLAPGLLGNNHGFTTENPPLLKK